MNELRPVEAPEMVQVGEKDAKEKADRQSAQRMAHAQCWTEGCI